MSEFALVPGQMRTAAADTESAAGDARGSDGAEALSLLAAALPGSSTAEVAPQIGEAWRAGVEGWCNDVDDLGRSIDALTADAESTDAGAGGLFGGLLPRVRPR